MLTKHCRLNQEAKFPWLKNANSFLCFRTKTKCLELFTVCGVEELLFTCTAFAKMIWDAVLSNACRLHVDVFIH